MGKVTKTSGLFFVAMLIFLSICTENYGLLSTSPLQYSQSENSGFCFSKEKPDFLFLYRNDERQINSVRNLPGPSFKNHTNYIRCNNISLEIKISGINSGYLSYAMIVNRSLTSSDIVFPSHYFW
jgi:hypothetical protein